MLSEEEIKRDFEIKQKVILSILTELFPVPGNAHILDAGCGIGFFARAFSQKGFRVTGVDFSPTAIHKAKENGLAEIDVGDLASLDLRKQFDVVTCIDVLFHVVDDLHWKKVVANLVRHLRPSGVLLIQEQLVEKTYKPAEHVKFRTEEMYRDAFNRNKIHIIQQKRYKLAAEQIHKDVIVGRRATVKFTLGGDC